ncbi:MAG: MtnX-like HAD-IB family phosphatase [Candidatus Omnitrophica bacterium]|nr:MtnX-like HAD-IB family phosphatase [Candidatus Omnitrophota bacterium]
MLKIQNLSNCAVFIDFDNTITTVDVLDEIIQRFSINGNWLRYENLWREEKIGSKDCMEAQLKGIRVQKEILNRYLQSVKLDSSFPNLLALLRRYNVHPAILSDSFSYFIHTILKHHNIKNIPVYANTVRFEGNRLIPSFPYRSAQCKRCAHCKRAHLVKPSMSHKTTIYVGDGLSDVCAALEADIVFAKGRLIEYLKEVKKACLEFNNLKDVFDLLKKAQT